MTPNDQFKEWIEVLSNSALALAILSFLGVFFFAWLFFPLIMWYYFSKLRQQQERMISYLSAIARQSDRRDRANPFKED